MNFPEIELYKYIKGVVGVLRDDISRNPTNSFVDRHFKDDAVGKYVFAKEIKSVISRPEINDNFLDVKLFFDAKRANIPTIHVTLPFEKGGNKIDGVGTDEGYEGRRESVEGSYRNFTRTFATSYNIVISTSNSLETIGLYRVLQAALVQYTESMAAYGFNNLKISGGELQLHPDVIPHGVFLRSINLDFDYQLTVEKMLPDSYLTDFMVNGSVAV